MVLIHGCANPGTPTGGPKDELPPSIKKSTPQQGQLNFKGKEVSIVFDELIQLKDANQKLVVSPPLNQQPVAVARGSELLVTFDEELQENTTYTLDFADAISDNNEGNVLENFRFSFSTGDVVDSLAISGHLFQADNLKPASGVLVFIHNNLSDTAFQSLVPVRLAKTDAQGAFSIRNVRPGNYHLFALDDANRNYFYDQPGEQIAWLDSVIVPAFEYRTVVDTIKVDSTLVQPAAVDSLVTDSLVSREILVYTPDSLQLFLFSEKPVEQYISLSERKEKARINIHFRRTVESFSIQPLVNEYDPDWFLLESSANHDSLSIWLKDPRLIENDSLPMALTYLSVDSLKQPILKHDTIPFFFFDVAVKKSEPRKKDAKAPEIPSLALKDLQANLDVFGRLSFTLEAAPVEINQQGFHLNQMVDSVMIPVDFKFIHDSLNIRKFYIDRKWEPGNSYELVVDSASLRDVYDKVNKPFKFKTTINKLDSYSTFYLTIENPQEKWMVQILSGNNEAVVRQANVPVNGKIAFRLIKPGEYMLRIVVDKNENGQWDTGDYAIRRQPEPIFYYQDKIVARANWEHVVKWNPSTFNIFQFTNTHRKGTGVRNQQ
jgi:uncharacterized protein (DUF2141 family)